MSKMKITEDRLAYMWCELNKFKVPKELQHCMKAREGNELIPMRLIEAIIGKDKCLEKWNEDV